MDGLAFYCRRHAQERHLAARRAREGPPRRRHAVGVDVPAGHKWCPDCSEVKPLDEFPRSARTTTGRYSYCKPCHGVRGQASLDKVGGSRTYHLKRRYGITAVEADAMLAAQGGLCAICRVAPAAHVDHDHATNAVRELLCFNCNGGLGQFRDDPAVLLAAVDYLEKHAVGPGAGSSPGGGLHHDAATRVGATRPTGSTTRSATDGPPRTGAGRRASVRPARAGGGGARVSDQIAGRSGFTPPTWTAWGHRSPTSSGPWPPTCFPAAGRCPRSRWATWPRTAPRSSRPPSTAAS
ncbi:endonuclease VII domain-containing protein [Klenkia terrae]|uniref:endonuclease VII domain-containing protein n=1 Tax=Klenkia terrae TaxID=1052259 RepID=UPI003616402E